MTYTESRRWDRRISPLSHFFCRLWQDLSFYETSRFFLEKFEFTSKNVTNVTMLITH